MTIRSVFQNPVTYDIVERMLEQVDDVRSVLSEDRTSAHLVPTWQDRDILH